MRALVLEGGGMRGAYTTGVLEAFAEANGGHGLSFPHVVACSAGACAAASYLSGQVWRNRKIYLDYLNDRKLVRFSRLLTGGSVMDIDYLADEVTQRLCPLDVEAVRQSPSVLSIAVTDWETGNARYLTNRDDDLLTAFRATCALPFFYRGRVTYQGRRYVDGGVADPVPLQTALTLGARDVVVVLTSPIESRGAQKRFRLPGIERLFSSSPAIQRALRERHLRYRDAARLIASPGDDVVVRTVRPSRPLPVGRTTTDRERLEEAIELGKADGRAFVDYSDSP